MTPLSWGKDRIDAVDAQSQSWRRCGYADGIVGVVFHAQTDVEFLDQHRDRRYDAINVSYGVSTEKAQSIARRHLRGEGCRMLAATNDGKCLGSYEMLQSGELRLLEERCGWDWEKDVTASMPTVDWRAYK
eukprot:gnl/TRDRNA2_/TRDRNA2_41988_c0_seq1.p2 gnl/TRDRNA2_/TRDRNA2_41988_c0~~gnl/TRDRNA2_/TRDRNA2_41988_c0_seq1.p2  ORF type:complete len:131 (-),score=20.01 gnl/TRDRNA2_/TRDRNA2_41988_c0_seq1:27-419(-)